MSKIHSKDTTRVLSKKLNVWLWDKSYHKQLAGKNKGTGIQIIIMGHRGRSHGNLRGVKNEATFISAKLLRNNTICNRVLVSPFIYFIAQGCPFQHHQGIGNGY